MDWEEKGYPEGYKYIKCFQNIQEALTELIELSYSVKDLYDSCIQELSPVYEEMREAFREVTDYYDPHTGPGCLIQGTYKEGPGWFSYQTMSEKVKMVFYQGAPLKCVFYAKSNTLPAIMQEAGWREE